VKTFRLVAQALLAGLFWETACEPRLPELPTAVDPVCERRITEVDAAAVRLYRGATFYFDTEKCARTFDGDPEGYRRRVETDRADWGDEGAQRRSSEVRDRH
jgi:YHS domain-containing protein